MLAMPRYDMRCTDCGREREIDCKSADRNDQVCECEGALEVLISSSSALHKDKRYVPKAIMGDGSKRAGHFGVSERRNKFGPRG